MKFACAGCHAQYMISDEKVGPRGVRVRCKKCDHVNVVRRPEPATDPDAVPAQAPAPRPSASLEDELGAAFASVTGDGPAADDPEPPEDDIPPVEKTSIISSPELQRIFAEREETAPEQEPAAEAPAPAASSAGAQWYLAIDDEQIGPLGLDVLQGRWEQGEIGPDTLCWRTGMADWAPLSQIGELADLLAPRPTAGSAPKGDWLQAAMEPKEAPAGGFQPSAAQALRDLVEAEREAAEQAAPPAEATLEKDVAGAESTGVRDLLANVPKAQVPDQELSRLIPIGTPSKKPAPAPAPAREPAGGIGKWVAVAAVLVLVFAGGAWAAGLFGGTPSQPAPVAAAPEPPPAPPPAPEPAPTQPPEEKTAEAAGAGGAGGSDTAEEAVAAAAGGQGGDAATAEADEEPAEEEKKVAKAPEKKPEPPKVAKAPPPRRPKPRPKRRARRTQQAQPAAASASNDLLDAAGSRSSIDSLFEREFAQSGSTPAKQPSGGGGYIPPAPGSGGKPHALSQGDIAGVVVGHKGALKTCATSYKESSGQSGGTVVMRWTIRPNGTTTGVRPVRGGEHAELASCIGKLVEGWKFPAYGGPQMAPIDFPFQF